MCHKVLEFDAAAVPHAARSRRSLERYVLGATGFRGRSLGAGVGSDAALPGATLRIEEDPAGEEGERGGELLPVGGAGAAPVLVSLLLPANASAGDANASAPGASRLAAVDKVFVVLLHAAERFITYSCDLPRAVVL
jgi:hypothetical protein